MDMSLLFYAVTDSGREYAKQLGMIQAGTSDLYRYYISPNQFIDMDDLLSKGLLLSNDNPKLKVFVKYKSNISHVIMPISEYITLTDHTDIDYARVI